MTPQELFCYLWEYLLTLFTVDLGMRNRLSFMCVASPMVRIWYDVLAPSNWRAHIIWNHDMHCNQTKLYFWYILVWVRLWSFHPQYSKIAIYLQGVRGQSGFFNWALRERNIQVRLYLKVVLKSWDVDILIVRTNFQKSNLDWLQQPLTEKGAKPWGWP